MNYRSEKALETTVEQTLTGHSGWYPGANAEWDE